MDGSLQPWQDIAPDFGEATLLIGNGLSINVWPRFGYNRLFDYAAAGGLTELDRALFVGTPNFERVLGDLGTALRVNQTLGLPTAPFLERYRSIQQGLGHAVRAVHLHRSQVPEATLRAIRDELLRYAWIFTTSYDLILYWAIGCGGRFSPFMDHFRWAGRLEFDPRRADVGSGQIPIYFLHGALHLVVDGSGAIWKLRQQAIATILEQFGQPIAGDPHARPLLVTEGSARDKLRAIERNGYLSHALDRLRERDGPSSCSEAVSAGRTNTSLTCSTNDQGARWPTRCFRAADGISQPSRPTSMAGWRRSLCSSLTPRRTRSARRRFGCPAPKRAVWTVLRRTYPVSWIGRKETSRWRRGVTSNQTARGTGTL